MTQIQQTHDERTVQPRLANPANRTPPPSANQTELSCSRVLALLELLSTGLPLPLQTAAELRELEHLDLIELIEADAFQRECRLNAQALGVCQKSAPELAAAREETGCRSSAAGSALISRLQNLSQSEARFEAASSRLSTLQTRTASLPGRLLQQLPLLSDPTQKLSEARLAVAEAELKREEAAQQVEILRRELAQLGADTEAQTAAGLRLEAESESLEQRAGQLAEFADTGCGMARLRPTGTALLTQLKSAPLTALPEQLTALLQERESCAERLRETHRQLRPAADALQAELDCVDDRRLLALLPQFGTQPPPLKEYFDRSAQCSINAELPGPLLLLLSSAEPHPPSLSGVLAELKGQDSSSPGSHRPLSAALLLLNRKPSTLPVDPEKLTARWRRTAHLIDNQLPLAAPLLSWVSAGIAGLTGEPEALTERFLELVDWLEPLPGTVEERLLAALLLLHGRGSCAELAGRIRHAVAALTDPAWGIGEANQTLADAALLTLLPSGCEHCLLPLRQAQQLLAADGFQQQLGAEALLLCGPELLRTAAEAERGSAASARQRISVLHNKLGAADAKQQAAIYQELTAAAAELGRRDTPAEPELAKLICLAAAGRNFTRVLERDVEISAARKRSAAQRARRKR